MHNKGRKDSMDLMPSLLRTFLTFSSWDDVKHCSSLGSLSWNHLRRRREGVRPQQAAGLLEKCLSLALMQGDLVSRFILAISVLFNMGHV